MYDIIIKSEVIIVFSKRLKQLRTERQVSQNELAMAISVSNRTISMYEQGNSEPNTDVLIKIAKYFNVSADYLIGLTEVKTTNADIAFISNYLGLSERCISELHIYNQLAQKGDARMREKINTLNMFFNPSCELLERITEYLNFSATHYKNFYDESFDSLSPISELELWDDKLKIGYSDDWDLWSGALLLIVEKELTFWRENIWKSRHPRTSSTTD